MKKIIKTGFDLLLKSFLFILIFSAMFELKSYSRKELSMLYFPENKPDAAYANLRRWLLEHKEGRLLFDQLRGKRIFSKEIVRAITSILGEP